MYIKSLIAASLLCISTLALAGNQGVRSVMITLSNMTPATFTFQGIQLEDGQWIKGLIPQQGGELRTYNSMRIGSDTYNINSDVNGQVILTGYGTPISISYALTSDGEFHINAHGNSVVNVETEQLETGEASHVEVNITLSHH
ncbi:MAG: hypothetical protein P1U63_09205 [Coxiellaceae bacterium]|nr:hypothetical protein [Coxiellaceae bacterium]